MSCGDDELAANVVLDFFLDRTPLCNPNYLHDPEECLLPDSSIQMEHSYSRDRRPTDKTMATRSLLVHKPPLCPSCHVSTSTENDLDMDEEEEMYPNQSTDPVDPNAKASMEVIGNIVSKMKNNNSENDDWEETVSKIGWTTAQLNLFNKAAEILSLDRLARLTHVNHPQEAILRRADIDKAVVRFRKILSMVYWDTRLTQWLHGTLFDHLPVSFLTAYMDILQSLRSKVPSLVDKMLQGRTNDLIEAVCKDPWDIEIPQKDRKLPVEAVILIVPSANPDGGCGKKSRERSWNNLFSTMSANVRTVVLPESLSTEKLTVSEYLENLVTITRTRLHEIRKELPNQPIILVGFNSGAALAIQVALLEQQTINSVICMGFSTNTLRGARGRLDDKLIELHTPVLFVIGQNSARTSQEQIEALREQMVSQTALIVVGSADDMLQVDHAKRKLESVTQCMLDNMIMDEVAEFTINSITNPPASSNIRRLTAPAMVVLLNGNSPSTSTSSLSLFDKKTPKINGLPAVVKKRKSPEVILNGIKAGKVTKKKLIEMDPQRSNLMTKFSPPKKEYCDRVSLSSPAAASYEIVTGKVTQDVNVRQVIDGGFIQITDDNQTAKWRQITRPPGAPTTAGGSVMLPVIQKQKISLGNQFTPLRTNSEHMLINSKQSPVGSSSSKDSRVYTITTTAGGQNFFSLKPAKHSAPTITETIDLVDTDDEILNIDGETILTDTDISNIPVIFQDSDGNLQDPLETEVTDTSSQILIAAPSNLVVSTTGTPAIIPRPNKYIYYKRQTIRPAQNQYVVLTAKSNTVVDDKIPSQQPRIVTNAAKASTSSSKPVIISVETPPAGTVYQIVSDSEAAN